MDSTGSRAEKYNQLKELHETKHASVNRKYNFISAARLALVILVVICMYNYFENREPLFLIVSGLVVLVFQGLLKWHDRLSRQRELSEALVAVNRNEVDYLKEGKLSFNSGEEYIDHHHAYSFDLDFFGAKSLFQNLNRTATHSGHQRLAQLLLTQVSNQEITERQDAIRELAGKLEWRQEILALGYLTKDDKSGYEQLMNWASTQTEQLSRFILLLGYLLPLITLVMLLLYILGGNPQYGNISTLLFVTNLLVVSSQRKKIKSENFSSGKISKTLHQYALIIERIEGEQFESSYLQQLKEKLSNKHQLTSNVIRGLGMHFSKLDSIKNLFATLFFNGFFLYHLHALNSLLKWKKIHGPEVEKWIEVIALFEGLNSLANFSYNNPNYVFPKISENLDIDFDELGHPLIKAEDRITNSISFNAQQFVVLTGSNMAGKSTFLRTLGINMVLAGIGAPICAREAVVHPLPVMVSMRLSDSLADSESYFFAEVKRLKEILISLEKEKTFILLDEIFRGTNSDDKRTGTVAVIRKIVANRGVGVIATHDLEVCQVTAEHPDQLVNKCFEVEIVNDELVFDYKLRSGICQSRNATFLMRKMGVIS